MRLPKVTDKFPREVRIDQRKISGVSPGVTKNYAESPWKYLSNTRGLQALAGKGRRKTI